MKKLSLLVTITFLLNACSFSNSGKEEITSRPSDELEFVVDTLEETTPADILVEEQKIVEDQSPEIATGSLEQFADVKPEEPQLEDFKSDPPIPEISVATATAPSEYSLGAEAQYHVQKGDTLMMIAFKIYGDYRKWKDLKIWNKGQLPAKIGPGVVLKYYTPDQAFGWQPSGLPYLVKRGDTLGLVSMEKYGTPKKWKSIYENNRPLIQNPNLIFAGFTIYYLPARNVASENR